MDGGRFLEAVVADPDLELAGCIEGETPDEDRILVRSKQHGDALSVPVKTILDAPDDQLMAVLRRKREPIVIDHLTRIVGYFSRVSNWNRSKQQERKDRITAMADGRYDVPSDAPMPRTPLPDDVVKALMERHGDGMSCKTA